MPYPLQFRPNTTVATFDSGGFLLNAASPAQIFRPMLGLEFNGLPANWDRNVQPGAAILRVAIADDQLALQKFGPPSWQQFNLPTIILNEEPPGFAWDLIDAVVWTASPAKIVSAFASKRLPGQDAIVSSALGAGGAVTSLLNPFLEFGRVYTRSFAIGATEWYNLYHQAGQEYEYQTLSETIPGPAFVTVTGFDGPWQNPNNRWNTGGGSGVYVPFPLTGISASPIHYIRFANTTGVASDTTFMFSRGLRATRKI